MKTNDGEAKPSHPHGMAIFKSTFCLPAPVCLSVYLCLCLSLSFNNFTPNIVPKVTLLQVSLNSGKKKAGRKHLINKECLHDKRKLYYFKRCPERSRRFGHTTLNHATWYITPQVEHAQLMDAKSFPEVPNLTQIYLSERHNIHSHSRTSSPYKNNIPLNSQRHFLATW